MIRSLLMLSVLLATPAAAAERRHSVGSFDRLRVNGPFEVVHAPGSPGARVSGDAVAVEQVQIRVEGSTLSVRMGGGGWGERPRAARMTPVLVTLSSPALAYASASAGGRLTIARVRGARFEAALSGSGSIAVAEAAVDDFAATVIGAGSVTVAGRARTARLAASGPGRIDGAGLQANELTVLLDGPGEVRAAARYSAAITNNGLGTVAVSGKPKCTVKARAGGPVTCGD